MSDYASIRGVTLSLKTLLDDSLNAAPPLPDRLNATITISRPDVTQPAGGKRLNLFLFQVLENHFIANQEDPRVGTTSDYGRPPLSLNLHYLLTPYSADTDESEAHRVLGAAMRVLHDNAILLPTLMTSTAQPVLDTSLVMAREHLRISLLPFTLDDVSKVWTGSQESMRLSVAYEVTVVQIDSLQPRVSALPVRQRNVVVTLRGPQISSIDPDVIGIGGVLTINGSNFFSATTQVLMGGATINLSGLGSPTLRSDQIQITVPNDPALWPGVQMVRAQVGVDIANAVATGAFPAAMTSEPVPIVLVPKVTSVTPASAAGGSTHALAISGQRLYRAQDDANIYVLIADQTIPASQFTSKTDTQIVVNVPNLSVGKYAVYVRFNAFTSRDDVEFEVT